MATAREIEAKYREAAISLPSILPLQAAPQDDTQVVNYLQALHNYLANDRLEVVRSLNVLSTFRLLQSGDAEDTSEAALAQGVERETLNKVQASGTGALIVKTQTSEGYYDDITQGVASGSVWKPLKVAALNVDVDTTNFDKLLDSGDSDLQTALESIDEKAVPRSEWLQNGFPDKSEVDFSWSDANRELTIQPAVTTFRYYYEGVMYTSAGALSQVIPDEEGLFVIYIDGEDSMTYVKNPSHNQVDHVIESECIVGYVYWDATNSLGAPMDELHGSSMSPATHHYLHDNFGAQYFDGMTVADILVDQNGNDDEDAQFSVSAGEIYDEDLGHDIEATGQTDTKKVYYTDGSGYTRWVDAEATFPVAAIGGVIAYNNAGTLTALSNNSYCLYHVFATNIKEDDGSDYPIIMVPGEYEYASKSLARDGAATEILDLTTGSWPVDETVPIATVIYQHKSTMGNGVEAATVSTDTGENFIDWRNASPTGSGASASDHGLLSGLSDDDHPLYLLASAATDRATFVTNWTDLTDAGNTALHIHDSRYYTQTETAALAANYLPLAGGTMTGNLFIDTAANPALQLRPSGTVADRFVANAAANIVSMSKYDDAGQVIFRIDPIPSDGTSAAILQFFRTTNTTGAKNFYIHKGDGTSTVQHFFNGSGNAYICGVNGNLCVGGTTAAARLDVQGGDVLIENAASYTCEVAAGGSAIDMVTLDATNVAKFGGLTTRTSIQSVDVVRIDAANSAPADAALSNGEIAFWIDESGNTLSFKVKYSTGTVKNGTVAIA